MHRIARCVAITDRRLMGVDSPAAFGDAIARVLDRLDAIDDVIVQVREKDLDGGALLAYARAAVATGARVLVNDRADVAQLAGAFGVHLPEAGMPILAARRFANFVGVSRHRPGDVEDADLIQLGPIFETPGKGPAIGVDALRAARPIGMLVAVGGIDAPARAVECIAAGADAVACIRAAWDGSLPAIVKALRR